MITIKTHYSGSKGNLSQIDDLIIDPGVPIKAIKKALNFQLSKVSGCIALHQHQDHCKAIPDLLKAGMDCYVNQSTADALGVSGHRLHIMQPLTKFKVGKWTALPFPVPHDVENYGLLMSDGENKVLYCCDCNYIPNKFKGLTHILLGVNHDAELLMANADEGLIDIGRAKRTLQNHMSLQTAKDFFRANDMSKVQEIILLHLSAQNSDAKRFADEIMSVTGRPTFVGGD